MLTNPIRRWRKNSRKILLTPWTWSKQQILRVHLLLFSANQKSRWRAIHASRKNHEKFHGNPKITDQKPCKFSSQLTINMARVSSYLPTDRQSDYALLAFPEKLWWIVNNPKREEIHWNAQGTGIAIPSIQRFVSEILNNPSSALFKTKHFASFVRQLNLYGFRKVTEYAKRTSTSPLSYFSKCEFKHPYFRKGRRGKVKKPNGLFSSP